MMVSRRDDAGPIAAFAVTGGDGQFRLAVAGAGTYRVSASAEGWLPASAQAVAGRSVDLVLAPGGQVLSGRVLDTGGGPIPGARVRAWLDVFWSTSARQPMVLALTGGDGRYRLGLPRGTHSFLVEADGYAPERASVTVAGAQTRDFRLNPAATIAGKVVRKGSGVPVAIETCR